MPNIYRSRVALTGWEGAPGVTTYYWTPGEVTIGDPTPEQVQDFHDLLGVAWTDFTIAVVAGVTAKVERTVDVIDVASGEIVNQIYADGTEPVAVGTDPGVSVSRATMICLSLITDTYIRGRRIRGRHFIGPVGSRGIASDGSTNAERGQIFADAYTAMIHGSAPNLAVYSRPYVNKGSGDPKPSHDGAYGDVQAVSFMNRPATLRSRRD